LLRNSLGDLPEIAEFCSLPGIADEIANQADRFELGILDD
jgi:hypothetical protein